MVIVRALEKKKKTKTKKEEEKDEDGSTIIDKKSRVRDRFNVLDSQAGGGAGVLKALQSGFLGSGSSLVGRGVQQQHQQHQHQQKDTKVSCAEVRKTLLALMAMLCCYHSDNDNDDDDDDDAGKDLSVGNHGTSAVEGNMDAVKRSSILFEFMSNRFNRKSSSSSPSSSSSSSRCRIDKEYAIECSDSTFSTLHDLLSELIKRYADRVLYFSSTYNSIVSTISRLSRSANSGRSSSSSSTTAPTNSIGGENKRNDIDMLCEAMEARIVELVMHFDELYCILVILCSNLQVFAVVTARIEQQLLDRKNTTTNNNKSTAGGGGGGGVGVGVDKDIINLESKHWRCIQRELGRLVVMDTLTTTNSNSSSSSKEGAVEHIRVDRRVNNHSEDDSDQHDEEDDDEDDEDNFMDEAEYSADGSDSCEGGYDSFNKQYHNAEFINTGNSSDLQHSDYIEHEFNNTFGGDSGDDEKSYVSLSPRNDDYSPHIHSARSRDRMSPPSSSSYQHEHDGIIAADNHHEGEGGGDTTVRSRYSSTASDDSGVISPALSYGSLGDDVMPLILLLLMFLLMMMIMMMMVRVRMTIGMGIGMMTIVTMRY